MCTAVSGKCILNVVHKIAHTSHTLVCFFASARFSVFVCKSNGIDDDDNDTTEVVRNEKKNAIFLYNYYNTCAWYVQLQFIVASTICSYMCACVRRRDSEKE